MERFEDQIDSDIVDLGVASEETKGPLGGVGDVIGRQDAGISEN